MFSVVRFVLFSCHLVLWIQSLLFSLKGNCSWGLLKCCLLDSCIIFLLSESLFLFVLYLKAFQYIALNLRSVCTYLRIGHQKLVGRCVCACEGEGFTAGSVFRCHLLSKALHIPPFKIPPGILYPSFLIYFYL